MGKSKGLKPATSKSMSNQITKNLEDLLKKVNNKMARFGKRELSYSEFEVIHAVLVSPPPNNGWAP
jgi:hypothetical protein